MGRNRGAKNSPTPSKTITTPQPTTLTTPDIPDSIDLLELGPKPDDVTPGLWQMFTCIHSHLKSNGATIQSVKDTVSNLSQTNEKLTKDVDSLERRMSLLEAKLDRSEVLNTRLQKEILDLQTRSMSNNIIITFDRVSNDYGGEAEGENCVEIVRHFLSNVMGIQAATRYSIPLAHRIGARKHGIHRPIVATFPIAAEMQHIMSQTGRLRNTGHFINRQTPGSTRERHQFAFDE